MRISPTRLLLLLGVIGLAACSSEMEEQRIAHLLPDDATYQTVPVCSGSGCTVRTMVRLGDEDWSKVESVFAAPPADPADERRRIGLAIGIMEILVGHQAGTRHDVGRNARVRDQSQQLDCVDEAVNTTTYLRLIEERGLLRWHSVGLPANRLIDLVDAHNTAVVIDRTTGAHYAVDSWFYDNGSPAVVVPLSVWRAGWDPDNNGDTLPSDPQAAQLPAQEQSAQTAARSRTRRTFQ